MGTVLGSILNYGERQSFCTDQRVETWLSYDELYH